MIEFLRELLESDFMPHAHCLLGNQPVLWLHVVSDALIALSYFSIPVVLTYLYRKRRGFQAFGVLTLFASFIFLCGMTHVLAVWTMWDPIYRLEGVVKLATAAVSLWTAVALWPLVPRILAIPQPEDLVAANEALRREVDERVELERRFRLLLESAPDAMIIVDEGGTIVHANQYCEIVFGYPKGDLIGDSIEKLVPEAARPAHAGHRRGYARDPRVRPMALGRELFALRSDGTQLPVEVRLSPLQTPTGLLVISAIRDISDRREIEAKLRELNDALALEVDDRTRELERRAADLVRSNEELEQFASVISHDLKSPMRGIASLAEWLVADHAERLDEEGRNQLELLQQRASRMHDLINGVLEYSRAAPTTVRSEEVDVNELLEEVVDALAPPDELRVSFSDLPHVTYPRVQLFQVFQNLVANAIAHMGRPAGSVRISCREALDTFEFRVSDDGPGIPPEHRERVFRMFQTLPAGSAKSSVGVGLAIVKKIVESNGGRVRVESSRGAGTTVIFTVPRRPPRPEAQRPSAGPAEGPARS